MTPQEREVFEAYQKLAEHVEAMAEDVYLDGHPEWETIVADARAALALAEKVSK